MNFNKAVELEMQAHPTLSKESAEELVINNLKSKLTFNSKEDM